METAPTPALTNGQMPPTPGTAVDTATPNIPVRAQRAAIEKVLISSMSPPPLRIAHHADRLAAARNFAGSTSGTASSNALVYSCCGRRKIASLLPISTMRPRYMTATRSLT